MIDPRNTKAYKLEKELKQYKYVVEEIQKCLDEYFESYYRVDEENQIEYDYLVGIENLIGQLKEKKIYASCDYELLYYGELIGADENGN